VFALVGFVVLHGCGEDEKAASKPAVTGHTSPYPDCNAIIQACHQLDVGDPGPIHACHDTASGASSNADCTPHKADCLAVCVAPADAGAD